MFVSQSCLTKTIAGTCLSLAATVFTSAYAADPLVKPPGRSTSTSAYVVKALVSDGSVSATFYDPNLLNPWGIAFNPNGFVWLSNSNSATSTLYDGTGKPQTLVVDVSGADDSSGRPTGIVYNGTSNFVVTKNGLSGPGRFIFAGYDGTISAWAPNVDQTNTVVAYESRDFSEYKGIALAATGEGSFLYATDTYNGRVDVFDSAFQRVSWAGAFVDPKLPMGYVPFGIQNLQGNLYVTYAKRDPLSGQEMAGRGLGLVNVFDANGILIRRVATGGSLNVPWGLAMAPAEFGMSSNTLLVANFGDGKISAFDVRTGKFLDQLRDQRDRVLTISGLRGIAFGNGVSKQPTGTLFFTSGPNSETGGLYGRLEMVPGKGPGPGPRPHED